MYVLGLCTLATELQYRSVHSMIYDQELHKYHECNMLDKSLYFVTIFASIYCSLVNPFT